MPYAVLADGGFGLREYMMTPFTQPSLNSQNRLSFNKTLSTARQTVEGAFGQLVPLDVSTQQVRHFLLLLHNFLGPLVEEIEEPLHAALRGMALQGGTRTVSRAGTENQLLSSQLLEAKNEMHRLHSYFMQMSENVPPTHHLSSTSSHMHHTPLQPINMISGAGEALCSRTDSNSDLLMPLNKLGEQEGRKHHNQLHQPPMHSLFSQQFNSLQRTLPCRRQQQEEEEDELITFRKNDFLESDCNEDFDCTEDPRHSKCSTLDSSACKLSPPPNNASKQNRIEEEEIVEDDVVNNKDKVVKEDDGYSTMLQNEAGDNKRGSEQKQLESQATTNSAGQQESSSNDVLQSGCKEEEEKNTFQAVNSIHNKETDAKSRVKHTPPIRSPMTLSPAKSNGLSPVSTLRKSFSETDLSRICLEDEHSNDHQDLVPIDQLENEGLCNTEEDVWDEEDADPTRKTNKVVKIAKQRPHRYETPQNRQVDNNSSLRSSSRNKRYCCYSPKRGDYSSSYSSDDDAIRVLAKQLRKRGEVVHFKPPQRKSLAVVNCQDKLFRHFGQRERQAIAQFEYLKEMPTDVSGLLSSPDGAQSPN